MDRAHAPSNRERTIALIGLALFLIAPLTSYWHKAFQPDRPHGDWFSIYSIAEYSLRTGELEADEADPVVRTQRYPPITRPLLMLLALPPKPVSAALSFALFVACYLGCATSVARLCLRPTRPAQWAATALVLGLVAPFVWADLTAGNLTSVLLASVTGAFILARNKQKMLAGIVLSIGIMLKIIPVLCLLWFLVRRQWRVAWGVALGVVLVGVLPSLIVLGPTRLWNYHRYWIDTQYSQYTPMRTIDNPIECTYQNQAVVRTLVRLLTHTNAGSSREPFYITVATPPKIAIKLIYVTLMGGSGIAMLWWLWRLRADRSSIGEAGTYAVCVGSMLWFSPWVGSYYYSLAIWPTAALTGLLLQRDATISTRASVQRYGIAQAAILFWIAAMPMIASLFLRAIGVHTLAAAAVVIALAIALNQRDRTPPAQTDYPDTPADLAATHTPRPANTRE